MTCWQDEYDKLLAWKRWAFPFGMATAYVSAAIALAAVTAIWGETPLSKLPAAPAHYEIIKPAHEAPAYCKVPTPFNEYLGTYAPCPNVPAVADV